MDKQVNSHPFSKLIESDFFNKVVKKVHDNYANDAINYILKIPFSKEYIDWVNFHLITELFRRLNSENCTYKERVEIFKVLKIYMTDGDGRTIDIYNEEPGPDGAIQVGGTRKNLKRKKQKTKSNKKKFKKTKNKKVNKKNKSKRKTKGGGPFDVFNAKSITKDGSMGWNLNLLSFAPQKDVVKLFTQEIYRTDDSLTKDLDPTKPGDKEMIDFLEDFEHKFEPDDFKKNTEILLNRVSKNNQVILANLKSNNPGHYAILKELMVSYFKGKHMGGQQQLRELSINLMRTEYYKKKMRDPSSFNTKDYISDLAKSIAKATVTRPDELPNNTIFYKIKTGKHIDNNIKEIKNILLKIIQNIPKEEVEREEEKLKISVRNMDKFIENILSIIHENDMKNFFIMINDLLKNDYYYTSMIVYYDNPGKYKEINDAFNDYDNLQIKKYSIEDTINDIKKKYKEEFIKIRDDFSEKTTINNIELEFINGFHYKESSYEEQIYFIDKEINLFRTKLELFNVMFEKDDLAKIIQELSVEEATNTKVNNDDVMTIENASDDDDTTTISSSSDNDNNNNINNYKDTIVGDESEEAYITKQINNLSSIFDNYSDIKNKNDRYDYIRKEIIKGKWIEKFNEIQKKTNEKINNLEDKKSQARHTYVEEQLEYLNKLLTTEMNAENEIAKKIAEKKLIQENIKKFEKNLPKKYELNNFCMLLDKFDEFKKLINENKCKIIGKKGKDIYIYEYLHLEHTKKGKKLKINYDDIDINKIIINNDEVMQKYEFDIDDIDDNDDDNDDNNDNNDNDNGNDNNDEKKKKEEDLDNISIFIQKEQNKFKEQFSEEKINEKMDELKKAVDIEIAEFVEQKLDEANKGKNNLKNIEDKFTDEFKNNKEMVDDFKKHTWNQRWIFTLFGTSSAYLALFFGLANCSIDIFFQQLLLVFLSFFYLLPRFWNVVESQKKNKYFYYPLLCVCFFLWVNIIQRALALLNIFGTHYGDLYYDNLQVNQWDQNDENMKLYTRDWWQIFNIDIDEYNIQFTCEGGPECIDNRRDYMGYEIPKNCVYEYGEEEKKACDAWNEKQKENIDSNDCKDNSSYYCSIKRELTKIWRYYTIRKPYKKETDFIYFLSYITKPARWFNKIISIIPIKAISGAALFTASYNAFNEKYEIDTKIENNITFMRKNLRTELDTQVFKLNNFVSEVKGDIDGGLPPGINMMYDVKGKEFQAWKDLHIERENISGQVLGRQTAANANLLANMKFKQAIDMNLSEVENNNEKEKQGVKKRVKQVENKDGIQNLIA